MSLLREGEIIGSTYEVEEIQMIREKLEDSGTEEDKREAREIEGELRAALQAHDAHVVQNRIEALSRLRYRVLARDPDTWVGWLQGCETPKFSHVD